MIHNSKLAFVLVGDHLGRLKRIFPTGECSVLEITDEPSRDNPIVSIEPVKIKTSSYYDTIYDNCVEFVVGKKNSNVYLYDCLRDKITCLYKSENNKEVMIKSLPYQEKLLIIHDKHIDLLDYEQKTTKILFTFKTTLKCAQLFCDKLAVAGSNLSLLVYDIKTQTKVFQADSPEPNWLGIKTSVLVSDLEFIGGSFDRKSEPNYIVTCSRSDAKLRIYDISCRANKKPVTIIDLSETAFNEHAESGRFTSISSCPRDDNTQAIVVASNVGQIQAIKIRLNALQNTSTKAKKLKKTFDRLGNFKGARGCTIKDVKVVASEDGLKVISCCLDRFLRIHNFDLNPSNPVTARKLEHEISTSTKPFVCFPVYYENI